MTIKTIAEPDVFWLARPMRHARSQLPWNRWLVRLRTWAEMPQSMQWEEAKPGSLWAQLQTGLIVLSRTLMASDVPIRASAISYTFVFSLIPLLTTTLAFFTALPALQPERERLLDFLFQQLLPGAVSEVSRYIERFSARAATAGAVSSLIFLVFILLLFQSVESTFNRIWRVERGRTWGERLQALALFMVCGAVAATALVSLERAANQFAERLSSVPAITQVALEIGSLFIAWALFTLANKILPHTRVRIAPALLGGITTGTLWHFIKDGFTWYVNNVASYQNIYGTLGTIPAFFLWVYLSMLLLLIGGHIAFVAQNLQALVLMQQTRRTGHPHAFYAVAAVAALARAFQESQSPVSARAIARSLHIASYFVREALTCLVAKGTVIAVPSTEQLYALAKPADQISVQDIVSQVTGEDLHVPEHEGQSELHRRLTHLFREANCREGNVLHNVHISDLIEQAPALADWDPAAQMPRTSKT